MTIASIRVWCEPLAWLGLGVCVLTVLLAVCQRWAVSGAWRRTLCQAGLVGVLLFAVCDLAGSRQGFVAWWNSRDAGVPRPLPRRFPLEATIQREAVTFSGPNQNDLHEGQTKSPAQRTPAAFQPDLSFGLWIAFVWITGSALISARICLAQCFFVFFRRRRAVAEQALLRRVEELAQALGLRRRVRVFELGRQISPFAFGLFRPAIGLPADFASRFDSQRQNAVLIHELAHLAAHDTWWCLLADLATIVLWWHPGVWWMRRQLHLASELAADEASLLVAEGPRVLAECLVELGLSLSRPQMLARWRISGFRSQLGCRVDRLMHLEAQPWAPPPRLYSFIVKTLGPMAVVAVVLACSAWASPWALTTGDIMRTIQLNWKRSLSGFALLTALNGQSQTVALAEPTKSDSGATAAPEVGTTVAAPLVTRVFQLKHTDPTNLLSDIIPFLFDSRSKAMADARTGAIVVSATEKEMADVDREIRHLDTNPAVLTTASAGSNPSTVEAKLKRFLLDQVSFDHLPLSEVLRSLSEQSIKLDPEKTGVNFLINPNFPPGSTPAAIDPTTGLPVPAASETFDISTVEINFNLPLRHVTMKGLLDAVVKVANHPIEYSVEDYAVVFSPKPEPFPRSAAGGSSGMAPTPGPAGASSMSVDPAVPYATVAQQVGRTPYPAASAVDVPSATVPLPSSRRQTPDDVTVSWHKTTSGVELESSVAGQHVAGTVPSSGPQPFNIDFGPARSDSSKQVGPAAAGKAGDYWNTVSVPWSNKHIETGLKSATGKPSPVAVEMINLGGTWSADGRMGVKDPMLNDFNYPVNNQGGNSQVLLHDVPPGKYDLYIYGHGTDPLYYGDYTVTVGSHSYGRKSTSHGSDAARNTQWVEGSQYVKFSGVKVGTNEQIQILIQPGGLQTESSGRTFADAIICGLQLIPR